MDLNYNAFGPDGAKALSEVLKFHGKIETLKLGWCQVMNRFFEPCVILVLDDFLKIVWLFLADRAKGRRVLC